MALQATGMTAVQHGVFHNVFSGLVKWIGSAATNYMQVKSRADQVEALHAKSDQELAKMGLKRDEIVQYVFRDSFYI